MTYSLAITTVERPYRQTFFQRLLATGTLTHPLVRGVHIIQNRLPTEAAIYACRAACADGADWVLILEDDIEIIDDLIGSTDRWLTAVQEPSLHFYPLGSALRRSMREAQRAGARTVRWPIRHFYGMTAVAFRRESLLAFCQDLARSPDWMVPVYGIDENLKRWHLRRYPEQRDTVTPVPCFVDHRGAVSSQTMAPDHFTGQYIGYVGRDTRY